MTMQTKKMQVSEILENGRYYRLTAWPILDVRGDMVAFSHSVIDITETKRAEEQIRYHADLLQNVSDAIIATDPEWQGPGMEQRGGKDLRLESGRGPGQNYSTI